MGFVEMFRRGGSSQKILKILLGKRVETIAKSFFRERELRLFAGLRERYGDQQ
jgi:hypothetical protein